MNTQEIVNFELDNFKNKSKKIDFTKQDKINTSIALSKALTDALSQGARRSKTDYKSIKDNLLDAFVPYYLDFLPSHCCSRWWLVTFYFVQNGLLYKTLNLNPNVQLYRIISPLK